MSDSAQAIKDGAPSTDADIKLDMAQQLGDKMSNNSFIKSIASPVDDKDDKTKPDPKPDDKPDDKKDDPIITDDGDLSKPDDKKDDTDDDGFTDDQIKAKLEEINSKEESERSDLEKEFLQEYSKEDEPKGIVGSVRQYYIESGMDFGEQEFTDDIEGLHKISTAVAKQMATNTLLNHLKSNPTYQKFYEHTSKGGSLDTFIVSNKEPEFKSITLKQASEDMEDSEKESAINGARRMIELDLKSKGVSDGQVKRLVDAIEDEGLDALYKEGKDAEGRLKVTHKAEVDAALEAEQKQLELQQKEDEAFVQEVKDIVSKNDFDGFEIPVAHKNTFLNALLEVDAVGSTLIDKKYGQLSTGKQLILDYLVMTDFKDLNLKPLGSKTKNFKFDKLANNNRKFANLFKNGDGGKDDTAKNITDISKLDFKNANFNTIGDFSQDKK